MKETLNSTKIAINRWREGERIIDSYNIKVSVFNDEDDVYSIH